jgi:hypothetical protein
VIYGVCKYENLTIEEIGELIKKYSSKPQLVLIVNNEVIEIK